MVYKPFWKMSQIDEDVAVCEGKLGKEPELPSNQNKTITYSDSIRERLKTGNVDEDRLDNYDNYWINKLACIDEAHSARNNLDIVEVEETLKKIAKYAETENSKSESSNTGIKDVLKDCYEMHRGETLQCSENVEQFIAQVDQSMYASARKNSDDHRSQTNNKLTFAEKFKRDYKY